MGKRKDKREKAERFAAIARTVAASADPSSPPGGIHGGPPLTDDELRSHAQLAGLAEDGGRRPLTQMKKFRFQLLHSWIVTHITRCRVADVGGGKGLLAYLLQESGWPATVIDPVDQALPSKFKDLTSGRRIRIADTARVPRLNREFQPELARHFDLLVAMHAHGCNIQMIDAGLEFGCDLILLPCCVIHEPVLPPPGVHWIQWLVEYVIEKGFTVQPFRLNFKGQNIGIYARAGK